MIICVYYGYRLTRYGFYHILVLWCGGSHTTDILLSSMLSLHVPKCQHSDQCGSPFAHNCLVISHLLCEISRMFSHLIPPAACCGTPAAPAETTPASSLRCGSRSLCRLICWCRGCHHHNRSRFYRSSATTTTTAGLIRSETFICIAISIRVAA